MTFDERAARLAEILETPSGSAELAVEKIDQLNDLISEIVLDPPTEMNRIGVLAGALLENHPEAALNLLLKLAGSEYAGTRAFACVVISQIGRFSPGIWKDVIRHLAEDDDRDVRDYAARIFDEQDECEGLVIFHPEWVFEILTEWTLHDNYLVRRVPTKALLGWAIAHPESAEQVLALLHPLFDDLNEFVRRNTVSSLRSIGKKRPDLVFDFLDAKAGGATDEQKELIRLVLDSAFAMRLADQRDTILSRIS